MERSALILIIAGFCLSVVMTVNAIWPDPSFVNPYKEDRFWMLKTHGHPDGSVNIILSGDSRVYRGLSPAIFDAALPGTETLNFGYSSSGHNPVMYAEIDRMLPKTNNTPRAVILGITPASLTAKAQDNGHYLEFKKRQGIPPADMPVLDNALRPLTFKRTKSLLRGHFTDDTEDKDTKDLFDNGWMRSDWHIRVPSEALKSYQGVFNGNKVDPAVIDGMMRQVRIWHARGIYVLGYRPPTTPMMVALEQEKSGFDQANFVRRFKAAGGIWVDMRDDFETFDGSHLTPESAEKVSNILAQRLVRAIAEQP